MLSSFQSFLIVSVTVIGSLLFVAVLNRVWQSKSRREHNELIGWQLGILGTTYAVILGFMLITVWTDYEAADANVDNEANALMSVSRLAAALPAEQRSQLEVETRGYAEAAVTNDWPDMAAGKIPEATHLVNVAMWKTLTSIRTPSSAEAIADDHALTALSEVAQHRRMRVLQSRHDLPGILWCVLILGAAVTIGSSCLFGSSNSFLHVLQVFAFSLLISLVLVAIADIRRPFQGAVHISDYPFRRVAENMKIP